MTVGRAAGGADNEGMSRPTVLPAWSVRARILAVILVITTLGMTFAGISAYFVQRDRVIESVDQELLGAVESARSVLTDPPAAAAVDDGSAAEPTPIETQGAAAEATVPEYASVLDALEAILSYVIPGRHESSIALFEGSPAWRPSVEMSFDLADDAAFIDRAWNEAQSGTVVLGTATTSTPDGVRAVRYVVAPVSLSGSEGLGAYVTAIDVQREIDEVGGAFVTYGWVSAITIFAIGVAGWFVAGRLLSPLRELSEAAERITARNTAERIPVRSRDDLGALTGTVNAMLDRIDGALTAQRRLLDDVRHELKTPITIVRGHLELLDPRKPTEVRAARDLAIDELDRMTDLVSDIDDLARAERSIVQTAPTNVTDLTATVFGKAQAIGDHEWVLGSAVALVVPVSASRITQAWLQLAENAAKYSPAGSTIRIGSSAYRDAVEFWVADDGPGIPEDSRERIFERFGRADTGRGIAGSGLGLPIVAAIARAHGGHVSLDTSEAGSRFGIVVPIAADAPTAPPAADPAPVPATTEAGR